MPDGRRAHSRMTAFPTDTARTKPDFAPGPVTLGNARVRLEPLGAEHAEDLLTAGVHPAIWRYMPRPMLRDLEDARQWIQETAELVQSGTDVAFAIIDVDKGHAVGSTRFLDIRRPHRGLEIGWTWLGLDAQRTGINTNCKYLLLEHAFETLGALRVQLKTDRRNRQSRTAIENIGAKKEGVLRKHCVLHDGYERDTVMYSIVEREWPGVKSHLRLKLL